MIKGVQLVLLFTLETVLSLGAPESKLQSLVHQLRTSIGPWLTLPLKSYG